MAVSYRCPKSCPGGETIAFGPHSEGGPAGIVAGDTAGTGFLKEREGTHRSGDGLSSSNLREKTGERKAT